MGNASAIRSRLQTASAGERALVLGALAVISGLLGNFIPALDFLTIGHTPPLPALWFGLVLCVGVVLWASRRSFDLVVIFLSSFVAWFAAVETAVALHLNLERQMTAALPAGSSLPSLAYLDVGCGMVTGLIGSAIVVAAVSAVLPAFQTSGAWARTTLFGTVAGSLLELTNDGLAPALPIHIGSTLPLFLVWQVSVAASIGYALAGKPDLSIKRQQAH
jgi:hypothetical protein